MPSQTKPGYPIPERLNFFLLVLASAASAALLFFASHSTSTLTIIVCAIAFSFTANTLFSLLHEAVHSVFSSRRVVNVWAGRFAAAWFPTGFSLQRAFHLTHHKNNRSSLEQFDILHEGDVKWLKYAQWYAILTGIYWVVAVVGVLAYLLVPRMLRIRSLREDQSKVAKQTSSLAYLAALDDLNPVTARLEIVFSIAFQGLLFLVLDLSVVGWLACYVAFAINWSSLQYTDHAFSPLDPRNGAWNLAVGPIGRAFFLNYHAHLAHHQHPGAPWVHLPSLIPPGSPQPRFFRVWAESWRGPRRVHELPALADEASALQPFWAPPSGLDGRLAVGMTILFCVLFVLFYGGASHLGTAIPWRFEVSLPFERAIPFVPEAAVVYLSLNILVGLAPFVLRTWRELFPLLVTLLAELLIGTMVFLTFPIQTTFPERSADGVIGDIFAIADAINLEGNFLPSLHVAFAATAVLAYARKTGVLGRAALYAWACAIALSTILMHEHHILDVVAGLLLAAFAWRVIGKWAARPDVLAAVDVELLCFRDMWQFALRHRRYGLIALSLVYDSLIRWRATRVLRTGFCFLQHLDDLLDGDRPSEREPLEVVDEVVRAIQTGRYGEDDLMRLASAFVSDIRAVGGEASVRDVLSLIAVMRRDRCRVIDGAVLDRDSLRKHHRETFRLSIDLMLTARKAELRAKDVPELIELLGWCSTMRDLREDLRAGIINIPAEVLEAAQSEGLRSLDYDAVVATEAVRDWLKEERVLAQELLRATENRLGMIGGRTGASSLRIFSRSMRGFLHRRFPRLFPSIVAVNSSQV
ncbi:MAG: fatty acid desaturase [Thiobacillus sp.]